MLKNFFRLIVCFGLIALGCWQSNQLFQEWVKVPRKDLNAWRIEYATINLNSGETTELKIQARSLEASAFKKTAIPNISLTLTNSNDEIIATQELTPNQWLPSEFLQDNGVLLFGIDANQEINSQIPVKIPDTATGYRIQFIYH